MKNRVLSLILALALCVGLSIPAFADYIITYPHLSIGKNGVFFDDPANNPNLNQNTSGEGWSWNAATYTLTLDNVNQPELALAIEYPAKPVTIVVKGTNTMYSLAPDLSQTSTLTGSGTLNLASRLNAAVVDGPTVNCSGFGSHYIETLKSGTVTVKAPVSELFDVQGGCMIIDARAYYQWYYEEYNFGGEESKKYDSAICFLESVPDTFYQGCTMEDETGAAVTLKKISIDYTGGTSNKVIAVKADGSPAKYVKITAAGYTPFSDVNSGDYFSVPVTWAVAKGITNGTSATTFSPNQTCTRGQIITFLWRAAGSPEPGNASAFTDVSADAYYAKATAWAAENGMTGGNTFSPDAPCTRLMAVEFMWKLAGSPGAAAAGFSDVASDAVNWAVANGVTNGTGDTTFSPDATCTRGQIVTFLYRGFAE